MKKISVAAVSYLNTKPLLHGIRRHPVMKHIDLVEDYPARIAQLLIEGRVDIGLIPVAATVRLPEWHLVGNTCIGCDGAVASVCIFSEVPMEKIETVLLDYQSRTSVNLARILLKEYWKKEVVLVDASGEDYRTHIQGSTAGVVIGDRALQQRLRSTYIYDLGEAWKAHTGLPFVFAAWIANKTLPAAFQTQFNNANQEGLQHIAEVVQSNPFPAFDLQEYYTRYIRYEMNADMLKGMSLFLEKLKEPL